MGSGTFFRFKLMCGGFRLLAVQGMWAFKLYTEEKKIENRPCILGDAENCWMALSVSVSLAAKLQKCLRLTQTAESMPTKSPEDRKWKKFRNFYDALGAEWKQGGEFAGKIIAFVKFKCVNSSTALQIDPEHTFPDFYARGRTRFWKVVEILKLQPSEMFKFSVGGVVGVRHITKKNDISLFKKNLKIAIEN